ncbi:MAG TPA: riboflavin synthase [Salinimicrobium sp.]|nr:riboflavin synthase [Salinimicrobium sp.]
MSPKGDNFQIHIKAAMATELKPDQSVSHNGVCLTVEEIENNTYSVTAIRETLEKTNLGALKLKDKINLERGMRLGDRLDGHIVQGHVDQTAVCTDIQNFQGSREFTFEYDPNLENYTVEKGSITVNGVSLTVIDSKINEFRVAIIPYTLEHTCFGFLKKGETVNLEFDVIGKYVRRLTELRKS